MHALCRPTEKSSETSAQQEFHITISDKYQCSTAGRDKTIMGSVVEDKVERW